MNYLPKQQDLKPVNPLAAYSSNAPVNRNRSITITGTGIVFAVGKPKE